MQLRKLLDDDGAVSPVIGVILMVAITVILAAVIATFVLNLGPSEAAPTAQFDFEEDNENVIITHANGDTIEAQYLSIRGEMNGSDIEMSWADAEDTSGNTSIGSESSVTVGEGENASNGWDLTVVWESDDGEQSSELASESR